MCRLNQDLALAKQAISQNAVPSTDFVKAVTEQVLPEIVKAFGDLTTAVDRAAQDQVAVVKQTALQSIRASIIEGLAAVRDGALATNSRRRPVSHSSVN